MFIYGAFNYVKYNFTEYFLCLSVYGILAIPAVPLHRLTSSGTIAFTPKHLSIAFVAKSQTKLTLEIFFNKTRCLHRRSIYLSELPFPQWTLAM